MEDIMINNNNMNMLDAAANDDPQEALFFDEDTHDGRHADRWLETASELYDQVIFKTDAIFNRPAPEYYVSFIIGGVLSVIGIVLWMMRVYETKRQLAELKVPFVGATMLRAMISRAIDNDEAAYTVASFAACSFLFLGGLQLDYQGTLLAMLFLYIVVSLGDTLRILLAVASANSLSDVVQTSSIVHSRLREVQARLNPSNVYEDLGRNKTIVCMVFITQCILIAFVFVDLYNSQTASCRDGSSGCPVAGTLGSYGFYVLGIFMACVYLLGPKTAFGQSEQNPAYWIQLLIAAKRTGASVTWFDPVENQNLKRVLSPNDLRIWARFFMSYLINGVGFHILVHALPIQVATQSSLTGVVFRAVGMVYLVDLDDTAGYTLTLVEEPEQGEGDKKNDDKKDDTTDVMSPSSTKQEERKDSNNTASAAEISDEAQRIIAEAKAQLEALSRGDFNMNKKAKLQGGGKLAAAAILTAGVLANAQANGDGEDGGAKDEGGGDDGREGGGGEDNMVVDA